MLLLVALLAVAVVVLEWVLFRTDGVTLSNMVTVVVAVIGLAALTRKALA